MPAVGDLIIYPVQPGGFPFGHVCVVVNVSWTEGPHDSKKGTVYVGEQNWSSHYWGGLKGNYSRALPVSSKLDAATGDEVVTLHDDDYKIVGWKRVGGEFKSDRM